ncbi:MAG: hypothetical protein AAF616_09390, partial [Bacteroidota bacterium]
TVDLKDFSTTYLRVINIGGLCEPLEQKSNSFLMDSLLYQIQAGGNGFSFTVKNITNEKTRVSFQAQKGETIEFKDSPIWAESSGWGNIFSPPSTSYISENQFYNRVKKRPGIYASSFDDCQVITIGSFQVRSSMSSSGFSSSNTISNYFQGRFDNRSLHHSSGSLPTRKIRDVQSRFVRNLPKGARLNSVLTVGEDKLYGYYNPKKKTYVITSLSRTES